MVTMTFEGDIMKKILMTILVTTSVMSFAYAGTYMNVQNKIEVKFDHKGVDYKQFFSEEEVSKTKEIDLLNTAISIKEFHDKALNLARKIDGDSVFTVNSIQFNKSIRIKETSYWYVKVDLLMNTGKGYGADLTFLFLLDGNSGTVSRLSEEVINK
jgi:hypothetical protein